MQSSSQAVRAKEDGPFLERFIEAHEGFILRTASRHAGHTVTRSDDEYSVALLAFYEAVKGYDPAGGPFGAYASLVIGRRLADYYRASHRFDAEVSLAPQTFDGTVEEDAADAGVQLAVVEKLGEMRTVCAAEEIESADEQFAKYGFSFYDLASCSPKSDKTRRGCGMAAAALSRSSVLPRSGARTSCRSARSRRRAAYPHASSSVTETISLPRRCCWTETIRCSAAISAASEGI